MLPVSPVPDPSPGFVYQLKDVASDYPVWHHSTAGGFAQCFPESVELDLTVSIRSGLVSPEHRCRRFGCTEAFEASDRAGPGSDPVTVAAARVVAAWVAPGIAPEHHYRWKDRVRQEWPTLGRAIDELVRSIGSGETK
jgi:hypothetical protein